MRSVLWVCAALVVVVGVMSTNLWRELRAERELSASLRIQLTQVRGQKDMPADSPPTPEVLTPATAAATPLKLPSIAAVVVAQAADAEAARRKAAARERELWKDPAYRNARLAQIRATIPMNYLGLAEELGLSAADEAALFDRMAEYQVDMNRLFSQTEIVANDATANAEISKKLQEVSRQREQAIAAQLGPAGYAQWQQYQQSASARNQANTLSSALTQAGVPLNAEQLRSLTTALVKESQHQRDETTALSRNVTAQNPASRAQFEDASRKLREESSQRMVAAAAAFLSPAQIAVVRTQMEQQVALSRVLSRARERALASQSNQMAAP
jgi:hypothetical protein